MRSSFPNGGSASADLPKGRPALALGIILDVKAAGGRLQLEETVTDMHPIVFSRIPIGVRSGGAFEFGTAINIHADFTDEFLGRAITDNQF